MDAAETSEALEGVGCVGALVAVVGVDESTVVAVPFSVLGLLFLLLLAADAKMPSMSAAVAEKEEEDAALAFFPVEAVAESVAFRFLPNDVALLRLLLLEVAVAVGLLEEEGMALAFDVGCSVLGVALCCGWDIAAGGATAALPFNAWTSRAADTADRSHREGGSARHTHERSSCRGKG